MGIEVEVKSIPEVRKFVRDENREVAPGGDRCQDGARRHEGCDR